MSIKSIIIILFFIGIIIYLGNNIDNNFFYNNSIPTNIDNINTCSISENSINYYDEYVELIDNYNNLTEKYDLLLINYTILKNNPETETTLQIKFEPRPVFEPQSIINKNNIYVYDHKFEIHDEYKSNYGWAIPTGTSMLPLIADGTTAVIFDINVKPNDIRVGDIIIYGINSSTSTGAEEYINHQVIKITEYNFVFYMLC